jgi:hypothetical protein
MQCAKRCGAQICSEKDQIMLNNALLCECETKVIQDVADAETRIRKEAI